MSEETRKYKTVVGVQNGGGRSLGLTTFESATEEYTDLDLSSLQKYIGAVMSRRRDAVLRLDGVRGTEAFINPEFIAYVELIPVEND